MQDVLEQTRVYKEVWIKRLSPMLQRIRGSDRISEAEITDSIDLL